MKTDFQTGLKSGKSICNKRAYQIHKLYNSETYFQEFIAVIEKVKNTFPGKDEMSYELIEHLNTKKVYELLNIYNQIFSLGEFPDTWKAALIIPMKK